MKNTFFLTFKNSEIDIELLKLSKSSFAENEGLSIVLDLRLAHQKGLDSGSKMKCISLNVYSDVEGVGLITAVSNALAAKKYLAT